MRQKSGPVGHAKRKGPALSLSPARSRKRQIRAVFVAVTRDQYLFQVKELRM